MTYRTKGVKPSLIAGITTPLSAFVYQLIVSGHVDRPSLGLVAVAVITAAGIIAAGPGDVVPVDSVVELTDEPPQDSIAPPSAPQGAVVTS